MATLNPVPFHRMGILVHLLEIIRVLLCDLLLPLGDLPLFASDVGSEAAHLLVLDRVL